MGARTSFIFTAETRDFGFFRRAITCLTPEIDRKLGSLKSAVIHDVLTDEIRKAMLGEIPSDDVLVFSENEIVTLYSEKIQDGCVILTSEGRFKVLNISLGRVSNPLEFLMECWRRIGGQADAALMGEELEADEEILDSLIQDVRIPGEADLCDAAIVRRPPGTARSIEGEEVNHGGILLRSRSL